jgi:hypothetical protein
LGRFEDPDHAEAGFAVGKRAFAVTDTLGKMADHGLERFGIVNVGTPDVASAIADQHAALCLRVLSDRDTPIVDLDLLPRL